MKYAAEYAAEIALLLLTIGFLLLVGSNEYQKMNKHKQSLEERVNYLEQQIININTTQDKQRSDSIRDRKQVTEAFYSVHNRLSSIERRFKGYAIQYPKYQLTQTEN